MGLDIRVTISSDADIVTARAQGRSAARAMGFSTTDVTIIATAISEVARNIVQYAGRGEILLRERREDGRSGLLIVARDEGPGIPDVEEAMRPGYSTSNSLGFGLPGAKRLVDEFEIESSRGQGTTITMTKWLAR
ncbi:MAG TPA: anti-sigma regulatory factor [Longimicrobiales bacterium]